MNLRTHFIEKGKCYDNESDFAMVYYHDDDDQEDYIQTH